MITLDELLALPKGTQIAYKKQRWTLTSYHEYTKIVEPIFLSEKGEYLYESIFIPHLITVVEEKI